LYLYGGFIQGHAGATSRFCVTIHVLPKCFVSSIPPIPSRLDERCRRAMSITQHYRPCSHFVPGQDFSISRSAARAMANFGYCLYKHCSQVRRSRGALPSNSRSVAPDQIKQCWTHFSIVPRRRIGSPSTIRMETSRHSPTSRYQLLLIKRRLLSR
jgi:hypothetical protein